MAWPAGGSAGIQNNVSTPRILATDSVKWTGEGVAAVVAETAGQAVDALDAIQVDYEPLPAIVDAEKATQPGAPQLHDNAPNNVVFEWTVGDKDGHRGGPRGRRGRRQAAPRQPSPDPEPDGGPRRHRLVQPGHRRVHDLDVEPDAAHPAAPPGGLRQRHPGAQDPLHQPGRRRRLRLEDLLLRRHGARHVRQQGDRRPAGEVGREPERELRVDDPRPRPHHLRRDRRQARRRGHRAPGQDVREPRRPSLDDRPGHPHHALRPRPVGLLQDPERLRRGDRRLHEHHVRRRLPRRRPARGDLRHRAGDGPVRQRDRDGQGRRPPQELHPARPVPVREPVRARDRVGRREDLHRFRQLRAGPQQGARSPPATTTWPRPRPRRRPAASSSGSGCRPTSRSAASRPRSGSARSARAGAPRCGSRPTSGST